MIPTPMMSLLLASNRRSVCPAVAVSLYQTLLFVAGAPHDAFTCASSASVVAPVVSRVELNGNALTSVAPLRPSFDGGAAADAAGGVHASPTTSTQSAPTPLENLRIIE